MKRKGYDRANSEGAIVPILRRLAGVRRINAYFMRKTTANLIERLTEEEQDAMMEISLSHKILCGSYGLRQWRYGEGHGGQGKEEFSDFAKDKIKKFRAWSKSMVENNPESLGICIAICTDEDSVATLSKCRKIRWEKTLILFRKGLAEWERMSGR